MFFLQKKHDFARDLFHEQFQLTIFLYVFFVGLTSRVTIDHLHPDIPNPQDLAALDAATTPLTSKKLWRKDATRMSMVLSNSWVVSPLYNDRL